MSLRLGLLAAIGGLLCGCSNLPEPYSPPAQRPFFEAPVETVRTVNMADSDAERFFVKDIDATLQGGAWRWTGKRPTIRLQLNTNQKLVYSIDLAIAGSTFQQTGPVTLSFFVNDHLLDSVRYTSEGRRRYQKLIPAEWLEPNESALLAAEIDKLWTPTPPGSTPLGFILVAFGLEQKGSESK